VLSVRGVLAGAGHNGSDAVDEMTGRRFLAEDPEVFTHDADGNLLQDGRWTYTWDAENRLVGMETRAAAVSAGVPKQKLEFAYDSQSRRFRKTVWRDYGSGWELQDDRLFLYDSWNLLAELVQGQRAMVEGREVEIRSIRFTLRSLGEGGQARPSQPQIANWRDARLR
jgi:YD repeat-containing protein